MLKHYYYIWYFRNNVFEHLHLDIATINHNRPSNVWTGMHLDTDEAEMAIGYASFCLKKKYISAWHLEKSQNKVSVNYIMGAFKNI